MDLADGTHRTPSPDGRRVLVIHACRETSMGRYDARVALLDLPADARGIVALRRRADRHAGPQLAGLRSEPYDRRQTNCARVPESRRADP